jgi:hypothetical protein
MLKSGLAALVALATSPALAECSVPHGTMFPGVETSQTMRVTSGRNCGIILYAAGQSRFDAVGTAERPKHGTLSPRMGVGVTYRSAPGYRGEDSFVFTVTGRFSSGTGTARVRVHVSVI